eukprot:5762172-Amphidinium_carterae.1
MSPSSILYTTLMEPASAAQLHDARLVRADSKACRLWVDEQTTTMNCGVQVRRGFVPQVLSFLERRSFLMFKCDIMTRLFHKPTNTAYEHLIRCAYWRRPKHTHHSARFEVAVPNIRAIHISTFYCFD